MTDVFLIYPTPEGSQEIKIDGGKLSFGRGSEAEQRFSDDGLSRLHATVYREGEKVWIVDENSSNGTFVNGQKVGGAGTPLRNGDTIRIGNRTELKVRLIEKTVPAAAASANAAGGKRPSSAMKFLPVALVAGAVFVCSISAVFVGFKVFGSKKTEVAVTTDPEIDDPIEKPSKSKDPKTSPTAKSTTTEPGTGSDTLIPQQSDPGGPSGTNTYNLPAGKKYSDLSDAERRQYLEDRAMKIAQVIGNNSSNKVPAAAIDKIKGFADAYASRLKVKPLGGGCRFGDNLQATYERASKNAPFIVRAFNEKGTDPRIGLYLAMIESEHCVCLQSPTGPLGMFQFTFATAKLHFVPSEGVIKGASPGNPDDRCKPEPAARAAASYMKALTGRYGTGPSSVPLAIGSYNSGEGGLSSNLTKALESGAGLERDFWTLIANGDKLSKQFQSENFKYVPKFFAAAIIGENPQDFGLNLQPISTYTK
jgi:hypothetical protein